jgi:hypothetical protein
MEPEEDDLSFTSFTTPIKQVAGTGRCTEVQWLLDLDTGHYGIIVAHPTIPLAR